MSCHLSSSSSYQQPTRAVHRDKQVRLNPVPEREANLDSSARGWRSPLPIPLHQLRAAGGGICN